MATVLTEKTNADTIGSIAAPTAVITITHAVIITTVDIMTMVITLATAVTDAVVATMNAGTMIEDTTTIIALPRDTLVDTIVIGAAIHTATTTIVTAS